MNEGKGPLKWLYRKTFQPPILNDNNIQNEEKYYFQLTKDKENLDIIDLGANECTFKSEKIRQDLKKHNYKRLDIDPETNPDIIADLNKKVPIEDNKFDLAISVGLLEHIYNPKLSVDEMYRILKKNGIAYVIVPFMYRQHGAPRDYFRFTGFLLEKWFKDFSKVKIEPMGGYFSVFAMHFFLGTYILDNLLLLGMFIRTITYPFWWVLTRLDKYDKYKLTASHYRVIAVK